MAQDDLTALISEIRAVEEPLELWDKAISFFHSFGIKRVSYHVYGEAHTSHAAQSIHTDGFPDDWVSRYIEGDYAVIDPIPDTARRKTTPFLWSEVETLRPLGEEARAYLKDLRAQNLGDGLAFQVFGPNLRNAYVGLGFGNDRTEFDDVEVALFQAAAQALHMRYCELTEHHDQDAIVLSPRELEVLKWIARGKSNSVIADLMGVSPHTIDTLVRRMFSKLEVADRTTAAIKGIGAGFLHKGELPG